MFDDKVILCGSSSYEKIFYFNPEFDSLPKQIKEELQIMCVLFTEDVGGILRLEFDETGNLNLTVESKEDDFFFDEIGSVLKIKQLRQGIFLTGGTRCYWQVILEIQILR